MGIVRVAKTTNYVRIENAAVRDTRLSFGARGVLAYALSKPDNWILTTADVVKQSKAGRRAVLSWFKELEQFGYLRRVKFRQPDGAYDWDVTVFEQPVILCNKPQCGCATVVGSTDKEEPKEEETATPKKRKSPYPPRSGGPINYSQSDVFALRSDRARNPAKKRRNLELAKIAIYEGSEQP